MFKVAIDPHAVLGLLSDVEKKQLPYATMRALNSTANIAQAAEKAHIQQAFRLRRAPFVLMNAAKIYKVDRARKDQWGVVIRVDAAVANFLNRTERGDDHTPTRGHWLFKPNSNVFADKIILRSNPLHPANLRFDSKGRGPLGTFMVRSNGKAKGPLILQRVGKGARGIAQSISRGGLRGPAGRGADGRYTKGEAVKGIRRGGVRMLYQLVARSRVPVKLQFVDTITRTVYTAWPSEMQKAMSEAMRTAR
jgi:hypothetical protein